MVDLVIEATEYSPFVSLNSSTGIIEFSGYGKMSDAQEFFEPIHEWIKNYLISPQPLTIWVCKLKGYNNRFGYWLRNLIDILNRSLKDKGQFEVHWCYVEEDENILGVGEDLEDMLNNVKFKFIEY